MKEHNSIHLFDWVRMIDVYESKIRNKVDLIDNLCLSKYARPFVEKI
jgi:hypothetical protein